MEVTKETSNESDDDGKVFMEEKQLHQNHDDSFVIMMFFCIAKFPFFH